MSSVQTRLYYLGPMGIGDTFDVGKVYSLITKYKEVPVRANMKLSWIDEEGRLLGFSWGRTQLRGAFSTLDPVYVEVTPEEFAKTQVFSNLGKELVLMLENFVPPPDFIKRRSVRVEPDENKPVKVIVEAEGTKLETEAKDVSETGVGLRVSIEEHKEFVELLRELSENPKEAEKTFNIKVLLPDGEEAKGTGKLRNVIGLGRDVYVRIGFEVSFPKREISKIRKYVMERQKEIVRALRMVR